MATTTEQFITSPNYDMTVKGVRYYGDAQTTCNWLIKVLRYMCCTDPGW